MKESYSVQPALQKLSQELLSENIELVGRSFNIHYAAKNAFIKVTYPWVKPFRFEVEVATAQKMHQWGVPVAKPLFNTVFNFEDNEGFTRYATFWEKLIPLPENNIDGKHKLGAEWITKLWELPSDDAEIFTLRDFIHAAHVRLDSSTNPLAPRVLDEILKLAQDAYYMEPSNQGFIHGDLHSGNMLNTEQGLVIIDWESSCKGPIEWDAAQNIKRFSKTPN